MPIFRQCSTPYCRKLVERGKCAEHQAEHTTPRSTTVQRGYGADWKKLRLQKLATDPICEIRSRCQGAVADEVDHIERIVDRPELRLVWSNLQSVCMPCHWEKTRRENARGAQREW